MLPKLGKGVVPNVVLSALSAFIVDVLMDKRMQGRIKRGFSCCRDFMRQLRYEGTSAYRKSRYRV